MLRSRFEHAWALAGLITCVAGEDFAHFAREMDGKDALLEAPFGAGEVEPEDVMLGPQRNLIRSDVVVLNVIAHKKLAWIMCQVVLSFGKLRQSWTENLLRQLFLVHSRDGKEIES